MTSCLMSAAECGAKDSRKGRDCSRRTKCLAQHLVREALRLGELERLDAVRGGHVELDVFTLPERCIAEDAWHGVRGHVQKAALQLRHQPKGLADLFCQVALAVGNGAGVGGGAGSDWLS